MASGIYEIVNQVNGKRYIGSAINFDRRCNQHRSRLTNGSHHNRHLQQAWAKYGPDAFTFRLLRSCEPEDLIRLEQQAIEELSPEYNVCRIAGSTLGVTLTIETRQKIGARMRGRQRSPEAIEASASKLRGRKLPIERIAHLVGNSHAVGTKHTAEWKAANAERMRGRDHSKSPEHRAKLAEALKGVTHSEERRERQSTGQRGKKRGPYKLDPAKAEERRQAGKALAAKINERRWGYRA